MRFNNLDANIPGQTYQFPTSVEGALGLQQRDRAHPADAHRRPEVPAQPAYSYGDWLSVGQISKGGRFLDNPGDPENWSNSYTQYIAEAAWRSYQIHGGQPAIAGNLARYAEGDVKGQLSFYDHNNNRLIEYDWGALTGNDADAVSFHWRSGNMDRAESAYAVQRRAGRGPGLHGDRQHRQGRRDAARSPTGSRTPSSTSLWNPSRQALRAPARVRPTRWCPGRRSTTTTRTRSAPMPEHRRVQAGAAAVRRPRQYPIFPFYTANQEDKAAAAAAGSPGSNNFSTINSTVQFRLLLLGAAQLPEPVDDHRGLQEAAVLERLGAVRRRQHPVAGRQRVLGRLERRRRTSTTGPGSTTTSWAAATGPSSRTCRAAAAQRQPRSSCRRSTSAGPTSRSTTSATATPTSASSGTTRPTASSSTRGVPQGYSIFINGTRVATVDKLVPLVWNPATGAVTSPTGGGATVNFSAAVLGPAGADPGDARAARRLVDMLAKAGVDLTATLPNLRRRARPPRRPTPACGTRRRGRGRRLSPSTNRSGAPAARRTPGLVRTQLRHGPDGRRGAAVVQGQPTGPANRTGRRQLVHHPVLQRQRLGERGRRGEDAGHATGQLQRGAASPAVSTHAAAGAGHQCVRRQDRPDRGQGLQPGRHAPPPPTGRQPGASTRHPDARPTPRRGRASPALNDGIDPPSSNDTVNPRWGTWPNTGEQWGLLTWPSAQTLNPADVYFFDDNGGVRHARLVEVAVLERHRLRGRAPERAAIRWRSTSTTT